jgi:hypothetical protein
LEIKTIQRKELDTNGWNAFVEESANPLVFSLSYNLDVFYNINWVVITVIENEITIAAIAIPHKQVFSLYFSLQHEFHRYNNIHFIKEISERKKYEITQLIFKKIKSDYKVVQLFLEPNFTNIEPLQTLNFELKAKQTNHLLFNDGNDSYINSKKITQQFRKLSKLNYEVVWSFPDKVLLEQLFKSLSVNDKYYIKQNIKSTFFELISKNMTNETGNCFYVIDKESSDCIMFSFFLGYNNTIYLHHSLINPLYANTSPRSLYIQELFNKFKVQNFSYIDFMGSMIKNVNSFNKNFNTISRIYVSIQSNIWILKIYRGLKKIFKF